MPTYAQQVGERPAGVVVEQVEACLDGKGRGDLIVELAVETPVDLSDEQRELVRRLASLRGEPVAPPSGASFFARLKSSGR